MTLEIPPMGGYARLLVPPEALVQGRDGALPAQHLLPGDQVIARDSGYLKLRSVSRLRLVADLVEIDGGYLPGMAPDQPLLLPVRQGVWFRSRIVPAGELIARRLAHAAGRRGITLTSLGFDRGDVVLAGGLALAAAKDALPLAA